MTWDREGCPMMKVPINAPQLNVENDIYELTRKVMVTVVKDTDEAIMNAIIQAAREEGVTDLYLIDGEFIVSAIKHEMERRQTDGNSS
jgi:hypothetical protein